jgi:hypothetical protein
MRRRARSSSLFIILYLFALGIYNFLHDFSIFVLVVKRKVRRVRGNCWLDLSSQNELCSLFICIHYLFIPGCMICLLRSFLLVMMTTFELFVPRASNKSVNCLTDDTNRAFGCAINERKRQFSHCTQCTDEH